MATDVTAATRRRPAPKPVQRWTASDYAANGRFVQDLAGDALASWPHSPANAFSISAAATDD